MVNDDEPIEEVSEMLRLGRNNTYSLMNFGEIYCVRVGKQLLVHFQNTNESRKKMLDTEKMCLDND